MRFLIGLLLGAIIGIGVAVWYQGEPPFVGSASKPPWDVSLTLSDAYLTQQAAPQVAARSNGQVSGIQVRSSSGDVMYVEGQGTIAGRQFPVGASLQPSVSNGTVVVNIHLSHVGPVPIPGVVVSPLMNVVNAKIASLVVNSPYQVVGVGTSDSGLEVYLKAR